MFFQRRTRRFGQTGHEHPRRSLPFGEGKPVIIKAGKVRADQQAGLLDIQEPKLSPQPANSFDALNGLIKGCSMDGLSTPTMSQIRRMCGVPP